MTTIQEELQAFRKEFRNKSFGVAKYKEFSFFKEFEAYLTSALQRMQESERKRVLEAIEKWYQELHEYLGHPLVAYHASKLNEIITRASDNLLVDLREKLVKV